MTTNEGDVKSSGQEGDLQKNTFYKEVQIIDCIAIARVRDKRDKRNTAIYITVVTPLKNDDRGCQVINIYDTDDDRNVQVDEVTDTDDIEEVANDYADTNIFFLEETEKRVNE